MSESENTPTPPPPSTPKTAAVPLKKETVRITLRSRPGAGATQPREATSPVAPVSGLPSPDITPKRSTAPIQLPSAPLPPPAPRSATAPVKLPPAPMEVSRKTTTAVPVMASPVPMAPPSSSPVPPPGRPPMAPPSAAGPMAAPRPPMVPGAPVPPGAPRPMAPGAPPMVPGAPRVETGATTSPLVKAAPARPPVSAPRPGAGTAPMAAAPGGAGAGALPKATVKLQQTQPMARPSISAPPSAPVKRTAAADSQQFYEEKDPEEGLVPLSVVCLLFSVVLMAVQMFGSDRISSSADSPIMVPPAVPVKWETRTAEGTWVNNFAKVLPPMPQ